MSPPPPSLRVSRESRWETLRVYKLYFGTPGCSPTICLNPTIDTVQIGRSMLRLKAIWALELSDIHHLEISGENLRNSDVFGVMVGLISFSSLQTVTLAAPRPPVISYPKEDKEGARFWQDLALDLGHNKCVLEICSQFSHLLSAFRKYKLENLEWEEPALRMVALSMEGKRLRPFKYLRPLTFEQWTIE
jgi:hypothetical protein